MSGRSLRVSAQERTRAAEHLTPHVKGSYHMCLQLLLLAGHFCCSPCQPTLRANSPGQPREKMGEEGKGNSLIPTILLFPHVSLTGLMWFSEGCDEYHCKCRAELKQ